MKRDLFKFTRGDEIKILILKELKKLNEQISFYGVTKKLKKSPSSIYPHCLFLEKLGLVEIETYSHPNKVKFRFIKINNKGKDALEHFEKSNK